ncbi:hypothetical protein [Paenibacillus puerhi]|uniref:hypothetical protein n=1 Tax=Paenibacillus puerhi TaxID=2692622 RepID=UPI001356960C|nr:hypothetical protein [Paenibacillus puerhi]
MKRRFISAIIALVTTATLFSSVASAAQTRAWHGARMLATYDGFWFESTFPTLYSRQSAGTLEKINWEFWHFINGDTSGSWVEMGYHNGYSWDSSGQPISYNSYDGLFVAKATSSSWSLSKISSANWSYGQNHTMGTDFWSGASGTKYVDMRSDQSVIYTFSGATPAARIDAGVEFGQDPILPSTSAKQKITLPSNMKQLSVRSGGTWVTWASSGKTIYPFNQNEGIWYEAPSATWSSSNNQINFN